MKTESLGEVYLALCETINSPRSLAAGLLYKYGEFEQLVNLEINPLEYCDLGKPCVIEDFRNDYLVTEMLSKYKHFEIPVDRRAVAIADFKEAEDHCRRTNARLREARARGFPPRVASVLYAAQRKISSLLYDVGRPFSFDILFDESQFGPGATFDLNRRCAYTENKVKDLSVAPRALKFLNLDLATSKIWNDVLKITNIDDIRYESHNRVTTVPKNAKKERTIGIEPGFSMFYQKSIGNWLRSQLKFRRIDLSDQSRNQELARIGSLTGKLATIDLKAASDSISLEIVYELFPIDFATLLDDLRSQGYELDGERHRYEKFSSMGNGFTFEVESVIFWALASSVVDSFSLEDRRLSVYGDDIIVPTYAVDYLLEVLEYCGFSSNKKKTHVSGPFRESCGKHYFKGSDVTPVYQKERIDVLEEAYRLANRLRRLAINRLAGAGSDGILHRAWTAAVRNVRDLESKLMVSFEVPINSELDGGLALPLSEMKGYAFLRLKAGDRFIRKKKMSRYSTSSCTWKFYVWNELRPRRRRSFETIIATMRIGYYKPETPFESSRLNGRYGPQLVEYYQAVTRDAEWIH